MTFEPFCLSVKKIIATVKADGFILKWYGFWGEGYRGLPKTITVDNGSEFFYKAMDSWAYSNSVQLDFIRPGKPTDNAFIESFNGKLRDELLNAQVFFFFVGCPGKSGTMAN